MTIKVTFTFNTPAEVTAFLALVNTAAPIHEVPTPKPKAKRTTPPATAPVEDAAPVKAVEKIPNGPIYADPTPVKAAPKVPNAPVQAVAKVDADAVRIALRAVFNDKGAAVATEILKQFGAARVSEIKPEDAAKFIKACAV